MPKALMIQARHVKDVSSLVVLRYRGHDAVVCSAVFERLIGGKATAQWRPYRVTIRPAGKVGR